MTCRMFLLQQQLELERATVERGELCVFYLEYYLVLGRNDKSDDESDALWALMGLFTQLLEAISKNCFLRPSMFWMYFLWRLRICLRVMVNIVRHSPKDHAEFADTTISNKLRSPHKAEYMEIRQERGEANGV